MTWAALAGKNTPAPAAPQVNLKPAVQKPPPAKKVFKIIIVKAVSINTCVFSLL